MNVESMAIARLGCRMGAFYGSIQIRSNDREAVKSAVESIADETKRRFLIGPVLNGWIAVYPDGSGQDRAWASTLSARLKTSLLQLIVHDDDVLAYSFFCEGQSLDEYSSHPDYFEELAVEDRERLAGKPEVFRELLDSPEKLAELSCLLERGDAEFTFEQDRLEKLTGIFGIQNALTSYDYLTAGEREGIAGWKQFIHIPDEKAAKKEASAVLRREKAAQKKAGLLCNEWQPPCRKLDWEFSAPEFCADSISGGFAVLWRRAVGYGYPPQLHVLAPPWESKQQSIPLPFPSPNPGHPIISASGNWLALYDQGLRLFDWRERQPIPDVNIDAAPVAFREDEKHLLCQGRQTFTLLSCESLKPLWTIEPESPAGVTLAVSPSNEYLVTRLRDNEFQRITLATGEVRKMTLSDQGTHHQDFLEAVKQIRSSELRNNWEEDVFSIGGRTMVFATEFSADGRLLFCATSIGLRVYAFDELFSRTGTTPAPLHAVTPVPEAVALNVNHYHNYVYDVTVDDTRNQLLFCGIEGAIRFLKLNDGSAGILVEVPGKPRISSLKLSHDRKFLCCLCLPKFENRRDEPPRIQVWNYDALCEAASIP